MTRCAGGIVTILVLAGLAPAAQEPHLLMEELTWRDIESALKSGTDTAIITIGATEQHGPHLPLASDSIAGDVMGPDVARQLGRALVAPNIRLGVSPHHMMFPGTMSVRTEILGDLLREYIHSLAWHGFRHIVILPTHGGNFATIERVTKQLAPLYPNVNLIGYTDAQGYIATLQSTSKRLGIPLDVAGSHSGLVETATVLAFRPELVRLDRAEAGFLGDAYGIGDKMNVEGTHAISPIGVLGDPRQATAEVGRESFNDLSAYLAAFARKARDAWRPPALTNLPYGGLAEPSGPLADGVRLRRSGKYEMAGAFFTNRLRANPASADASMELARTQVLAGDLREARATLTPLLTHAEPRIREQAHDEVAYVDLYHGRFTAAVQHKREARALRAQAGDKVGEAHKLFYIGYIQTELGQFDEAAATYEEALGLAPVVNDVNLDLQHLVGLLEIARGRLTRAGMRLRSLEDAVIQPQWAAHVRRFYHLNGELLLARGRVDDALVSLAPAIRIYDHPLYRETLARAYARAGRNADAEREFRHLLELRDARLDVPIHYVKAHASLAHLYDTMGRRADADALYRKVLSYWGETDVPLAIVAEAKTRIGPHK